MNVLLLTPDRVGSTLLQRTLTIYMLRKGFNKPVINLHELTNGLEKYYNTLLNQEVLGKPKGTEWGYYQTLPEVLNLLKSVDHYKTTRLAHYHLERRGDSIADQLEFYDYLNKNFFIISCRRRNLFEHVLSWGFFSHSKVLNVYSVEEKISRFADLYENGITLVKERFLGQLEAYKRYIEWSEKYFDIQSYFNYEDSINDLESYILNLDFMNNAKENTWNDMFGVSFEDWNKCHKMIPDLKLYEKQNDITKRLDAPVTKLLPKHTWETHAGSDWPKWGENLDNVTPDIKQEVMSLFEEQKETPSMELSFPDEETFNFLNKNIGTYLDVKSELDQLVNDGFLVTGVPIKLQTFEEKKRTIKNYEQTIEWYNEWAVKEGYETFSEDKKILSLESERFGSMGPKRIGN